MTLLAVTVLALAWGALVFGAVYIWAYTPLAIATAVTGFLDFGVTRTGRPPIGALFVGLTAIGVAIALQLVPLPQTALDRITPAASPLLKSYDESFGVIRSNEPPDILDEPASDRHSISISASRTKIGIMLFGSLALFLVGTSRLLSREGGLALAQPLVIFGILLSLIGIGQYTLTLHVEHPLIYGFWKPQSEAARPFGPFVNPNHFAGWMLMALPIALALFYEALERTLAAAVRRKGNRVSVASLPEFGRTLMFGFSAVVMGLSLTMTKSRSALIALAAVSLLALSIVLRRQRSFAARAIVVVGFLLVVGGASAWAGLDMLVGKAVSTDAANDSFGGRIRAWRDTRRLIADFPMTGTGFNTYGTAMAVYQTGQRDVHFEEAHNEYLQLAAEGGLLVGLPILFTLGIFVRDVRRRFREAPRDGTTYWLRIGAVLGLTAIALQSLMDFSLQMPGNAALCAVLAAIAIHQSPNLRSRRTTITAETAESAE